MKTLTLIIMTPILIHGMQSPTTPDSHDSEELRLMRRSPVTILTDPANQEEALRLMNAAHQTDTNARPERVIVQIEGTPTTPNTARWNPSPTQNKIAFALAMVIFSIGYAPLTYKCLIETLGCPDK